MAKKKGTKKSPLKKNKKRAISKPSKKNIVKKGKAKATQLKSPPKKGYSKTELERFKGIILVKRK